MTTGTRSEVRVWRTTALIVLRTNTLKSLASTVAFVPRCAPTDIGSLYKCRKRSGTSVARALN